MKVKCVIGANYGDEGKGMMTDYFCHQAWENNERAICVLSNGGAQRGHTVEVYPNIRHVFHHFGSGTIHGADTFCTKQFIVNPIIFMDEVKEIEDITGETMKHRLLLDSDCRMTVPYFMILNQSIESARNKRHGSCGMGIWETISCPHTKTFGEFEKMSQAEKLDYLVFIRDVYVPKRLAELNATITPEWEKIYYSKELLDHFIEDFNQMRSYVECVKSVYDALIQYDVLVFENGQGLMLDESLETKFNHVTPSSTGLKNPALFLRDYGFNPESMEVCYVTRTYLTKHGAGPFPEECDMAKINPEIEDKTNIPNPFQGTLRFGRLDPNALIDRCNSDFHLWSTINPDVDAYWCFAFTHLNEFFDSKAFVLCNQTAPCYVNPEKTYKTIKQMEVNFYE